MRGLPRINGQEEVRIASIGAAFKADLEEVLSRFSEFASDTGTATGGSETTLVDSAKSWATNMWKDAVLEVYVETESTYYFRVIASNTANTLTMAALGASKVVAAGDDYAIRLVESITQTEAMAGQATGGTNVTTTSGTIVAANTSRRGLVIVNDSDTAMWVAIGQTAVVNQGIRLNAKGGTLVLSRHGTLFSTELVAGIHAATGNKVAAYQELQ